MSASLRRGEAFHKSLCVVLQWLQERSPMHASSARIGAAIRLREAASGADPRRDSVLNQQPLKVVDEEGATAGRRCETQPRRLGGKYCTSRTRWTCERQGGRNVRTHLGLFLNITLGAKTRTRVVDYANPWPGATRPAASVAAGFRCRRGGSALAGQKGACKPDSGRQQGHCYEEQHRGQARYESAR